MPNVLSVCSEIYLRLVKISVFVQQVSGNSKKTFVSSFEGFLFDFM